MASKKKEGIIIVLDVGKNALQLNTNGKSYFEQSLHCVSMLIQRKLLLESKDELALILFGSSNTNNPLALEGPGYQNIEVVTNLGLATWDLAKFVTNITPTNITPSDWLSALILATHLLKNESENKIYSDLQIVIFSNFMADILPDKIDVIVKCINYLEIKLSLLGKDYTDIVNKNQLLEKFIEETDAQAANLEVAVNQLSHYKHKDVVPRVWTVALSFGSIFSIKVSGFKKVDETLKTNKWVLCSKLDKPEAITPIKTETSYYYVKNGIKVEVNKFDLIDAFRFGDTIIPITDINKETYSYKSGSKSLQVLGFTDLHKIHRSCWMNGGSYIFKPADEESTLAFEALFNVMSQKKIVMIVRKVYMLNSLPSVGIMYPVNYNDQNVFMFASLPYAQDLRKQLLPSFENYKPNEKQKDVIFNLIKSMDLEKNEGNEYFVPEYTHSPQHQLLNYLIAKKALNPHETLASEIPENIKQQLFPPSEITEHSYQFLNEIKNCFKLVSNVEQINENKDYLNVVGAINNKTYDNISKPCVITELSPVDDFNKLLEEGFDSGIVCEKMKKLTINLIETSNNLEELEKPISTLKTLRKFYVYNKDVNSYNNWMYHVKDSILLTGKQEMWPQFIERGIGLITNIEVENCTVSQEIANDFTKIIIFEDLEEIVFDDDNDDMMYEFL